jgi:hypothetical protein
MGWIGLDSKKRQMDWNGLDLRSLLLWFGLVVGWISNHWQAYFEPHISTIGFTLDHPLIFSKSGSPSPM